MVCAGALAGGCSCDRQALLRSKTDQQAWHRCVGLVGYSTEPESRRRGVRWGGHDRLPWGYRFDHAARVAVDIGSLSIGRYAKSVLTWGREWIPASASRETVSTWANGPAGTAEASIRLSPSTRRSHGVSVEGKQADGRVGVPARVRFDRDDLPLLTAALQRSPTFGGVAGYRTSTG